MKRLVQRAVQLLPVRPVFHKFGGDGGGCDERIRKESRRHLLAARRRCNYGGRCSLASGTTCHVAERNCMVLHYFQMF